MPPTAPRPERATKPAGPFPVLGLLVAMLMLVLGINGLFSNRMESADGERLRTGPPAAEAGAAGVLGLFDRAASAAGAGATPDVIPATVVALPPTTPPLTVPLELPTLVPAVPPTSTPEPLGAFADSGVQVAQSDPLAAETPTPTVVPVVPTAQPTSPPVPTAQPAAAAPTATPDAPPVTPTPLAQPTPASTATPVPTATVEPTATPLPEPTAIPDVGGFSAADMELYMLGEINAVRASAGLGPVELRSDISAISRDWSATMAAANGISHRPSGELSAMLPSGWWSWGENVAVAPDIYWAQSGLEQSPGHYQNMVNPSFTHVGLGVVIHGRSVWVTQNFVGY